MGTDEKQKGFLNRLKKILRISGTAKGEYELKEFKQQLLILMIIIIIVLQIVGAWLFMREMGWVGSGTPAKYDRNVAVLELNEEITDTYVNKIIGNLEKIKEEKEKFPHLFIIVSSPGGSPQGSSELYHYLQDFQKEIPVTMYIQNMAMSGAFYIACASKYDPKNPLSGIIAQENSLVGSIGVILPHMVYEVANNYVKEDDLLVGKFKKPISNFRAMTDEDKKYLHDNMLYPVYQHFLQAVANGRQMKIDEVEKYAEGQVFVSTEVVGKLVDRISYVTKIKEEIKENVEKRFPDEEVGFVPISMKKRDGGLFNVKLDINGLSLNSDVADSIESHAKYNMK